MRAGRNIIEFRSCRIQNYFFYLYRTKITMNLWIHYVGR